MEIKKITKEEKFLNVKKFADKYYPLKGNDAINPEETKRLVWYCNYTGIFIPELQEKYGCQIDFKEEDDENLCFELNLIKAGYTNYQVYPCSHCFLDVSLLCALYDNINFCWSPKFSEERAKQIINNLDKCPICNPVQKSVLKSLNKNNYDEKLIPYIVSNELITGSVILRPIFPKKYIHHLADLHVFEEGDLVDVDGYRGIGLYILDDDGKFKQVKTGEYYPGWPIKWLKKRGYRYYVDTCIYFDAIPFEDNIYLAPDGKFRKTDQNKFCLVEPPTVDDGFIDDSLQEEHKQTGENSDEENEAENKEDFSSEIIDCETISYPFEDVLQLNLFRKSKKTYKAKLNDKEYLVFSNGNIFLCNMTGLDVVEIWSS